MTVYLYHLKALNRMTKCKQNKHTFAFWEFFGDHNYIPIEMWWRPNLDSWDILFQCSFCDDVVLDEAISDTDLLLAGVFITIPPHTHLLKYRIKQHLALDYRK
jgi:hypothetical protein